MIREITFEVMPTDDHSDWFAVRAYVFVGLDKHLRDVYEHEFTKDCPPTTAILTMMQLIEKHN